MQQQQSFDMSQPAPRVNGALMGRFVGKRVKLVGQIISATGGVMELKAADEQTVHVNLAGPAPGGIYVEFEGIVESPNTIKEESHTLFSENFGGWLRQRARAWARAVELQQCAASCCQRAPRCLLVPSLRRCAQPSLQPGDNSAETPLPRRPGQLQRALQAGVRQLYAAVRRQHLSRADAAGGLAGRIHIPAGLQRPPGMTAKAAV